MCWIDEWVRPGMTVLDIGANRGEVASPLASAVTETGRVIAIEPNPAHRATLEALSPRIQVLTLAVGDHDGDMPYYQCRDSQQNTLYEPNAVDVQATGTVPIRRIDGLNLPPVQVIKADTQGAELAWLRGAAQLIARDRPVVYVEVWPPGLRAAGDSVEALCDWFEARGYVPHARTWASIRTLPDQDGSHQSSDVVFVPGERV